MGKPAHPGHATRPGPRDRRELSGPATKLFIGVGREAGVKPGDLVGAITGEAGVSSSDIGKIEMSDRFALVEVPEALAEAIIAALRATTIRGKKPAVRRASER